MSRYRSWSMDPGGDPIVGLEGSVPPCLRGWLVGTAHDRPPPITGAACWGGVIRPVTAEVAATTGEAR